MTEERNRTDSVAEVKRNAAPAVCHMPSFAVSIIFLRQGFSKHPTPFSSPHPGVKKFVCRYTNCNKLYI